MKDDNLRDPNIRDFMERLDREASKDLDGVKKDMRERGEDPEEVRKRGMAFIEELKVQAKPVTQQERETLTKTLDHIERVGHLLGHVVADLHRRAVVHDRSKLEEPELSRFAEVTHKLSGVTYGSDEYQALLDDLRPALDHHYAQNAHHPEHHENGVDDMTLMDLMEMLVDWKAASERHDDGDISASIAHNQERFALSDQLARILQNTADALEGA